MWPCCCPSTRRDLSAVMQNSSPGLHPLEQVALTYMVVAVHICTLALTQAMGRVGDPVCFPHLLPLGSVGPQGCCARSVWDLHIPGAMGSRTVLSWRGRNLGLSPGSPTRSRSGRNGTVSSDGHDAFPCVEQEATANSGYLFQSFGAFFFLPCFYFFFFNFLFL